MADYYLAPSLAVLRTEINTRWPRRDKASDGWIGDPAHQATKSDHNPNERGSVNALDVDEDGIDVWAVFAAIKRHPSARYFIYERKLYHRLRGWRAESYSGVNPHDKHFHLSIDQTRTAEQDRRPWGLIQEDSMTEAEKIAWATTNRTAALLAGTPASFQIEGEKTRRQEPNRLQESLLRLEAGVAKLLGADPVNEEAIVAGVLAGLGVRPEPEVATALVAAGQDPQRLAEALLALVPAQE